MYGIRKECEQRLFIANESLAKFISIVSKPRLILNKKTGEVVFELLVPEKAQVDVDRMKTYIKFLAEKVKEERKIYYSELEAFKKAEGKMCMQKRKRGLE